MLRRDAPITAFFITILLLVAAAMSAGLGVVYYVSESARRYADLRSDTSITADQAVASLELAAWNFDEAQIQRILAGIMRDTTAYGVVVTLKDVSSPDGLKRFGLARDDHWHVVPGLANFSAAGMLVQERDIGSPDGHPIGSLTLYFTPQFMRADLWGRIAWMGAVFVILAGTLIGTLYVLMWRGVIHPLRLIEQYAAQVSSGDTSARIVTDRPFQGELSHLQFSIEQMVGLLSERYTALQESERLVTSQLRFRRLASEVLSLLAGARPETLNESIVAVLKGIAEQWDVDRVDLCGVDENGDLIERTNYVRSGLPPDNKFTRDSFPTLWPRLKAGELLDIRDIATLPEQAAIDRTSLEREGIKSILVVPTLSEGRVLYVLSIASVGREIEWPADMVMRVGVLAEFMVQAILRCEAELAARERLHRIQHLATQLTHAEERQRREFATILHDEVGQNLFAATTYLLAMKTTENAGAVDNILSLLDRVTRDTRELTFELCPPVLYQLGLSVAIARLCEQFSQRHGIQCTFKGSSAGPADLNARGLAYHAVRELLTNVAKHSSAKNAMVRLTEENGQMHMDVSDDGHGFELGKVMKPTSGFGLYELRERLDLLGGRLDIQSEVGHGCRIEFSLPLETEQRTE
ncbi:MAG TPA: ATP-binding protein [Phycisphaerae bacterium]|nr:ATP-binding protein [Phycisphaerae bacterium]